MNSIKQLITLTNRIIKQNFTNADTIITVILMPVFMMLFFVYVMGGNIVTGGSAPSTAEYLNYALPGFLLLTMATGLIFVARTRLNGGRYCVMRSSRNGKKLTRKNYYKR